MKSFAERCSMNTPIQGTAADILKLAIGRILTGLPQRPWLKPILQIHDELTSIIPAERLDEAVSYIKACMEPQPFPDIICCLDGRFLSFEVKTESGKPTKLQEATIRKIISAGGTALIVRSVDEVKAVINAFQDE